MSQNLISQPYGEPITITNNALNIPDFPIIPFIEGDGIGQDISPAMQKVINAAVLKAYDGVRKLIG
jgi:isocitrate dehydrogenase